jgi:Dolichyl-phosphate-mannose-protein mannosyltransferase
MRFGAATVSHERAVLLGMWALAVLGCFLGLVFPPPAGTNLGLAEQLLDLVRLLTSAALSIVLVLGPGLVIRIRNPRRHWELGFVPIPGMAMLVVIGCVAWVLAREIHPRIVCALALALILVWLLVSVVRAGPDFTTSEERGALAVVAAALGIAIARSLWSLGPSGELLGGTTFRTLEVGATADSVVPYRIVQLVAHGGSPFGSVAQFYFGSYTFSSRGPLSGLASAPVVLGSGGRPPTGSWGAPWSPFDPQGFMSYRLATMTFASTALLSVWTLTRRLGGKRAARFALLLAATTPFLIHEIWFTWPKLLAASLVLLSATSLIKRRPLVAGLLLGAAYLAHPLALFSVPSLVLLAFWPLEGTRPSRPLGPRTVRSRGPARAPRIRVPRPRVGPAVLMLGGLAVWLVAWRVANGSHYTQTNFLHYLTASGANNLFIADAMRAHGLQPPPVALSAWLSDRLVLVGNTLLPLRVLLLSPHDLNAVCGVRQLCVIRSPFVVHFFLQYWVAVPFGLGIVFFPLLLQGLWRALKRCPWAVTATVIVPFVAFAIYWGDASTGLLREGLHTWVLTVLVVVALEQQRERFWWLRHPAARALLTLRSLEVLLLAMLPTIVTRHRLYEPQFPLTDVVAVVGMVAACGYLARMVWRERAPHPDDGTTHDQRQPQLSAPLESSGAD